MSAPASARRTDQTVLLISEVLLAVVTFSAVVGFDRLFSDTTWIRPLLTAVLVAHVTFAALRRLRRGLLLTGLVGLGVMALQITWTHYRDTTSFGLPTFGTRDQLDIDLTTSWNLFSEVKAPTETTVGFLVMATVAVWIIAYLADWAAFRLWSALETVLPSFAMFVFVAFFGIEDNRFFLAGLYLLAVVGFQLAHRLIRQAQEVRWLAGMQHLGMAAVARTGAVVGIVAVLGAVAGGPALPGAEQEPIIDLDQRRSGPDTRVVISPIVDIRGRIVEQADVEAFTVRSALPSYWRLASLDSFNGQIWGADNKYSRASGQLPDDFEVNTDVVTTTQQFDITALDMVWIPAAFEPRRIFDASDESISYEPISGTLIVGRDRDSSDGLSYTVESAIPQFDPAALAVAPDVYPSEVLDRYRQLPDDFSTRATALALDLTRDLANDYDRALALQNYFRDNFAYDINVGVGHSSNRIDAFLDSRAGYCEQFAGSFAAMARAIGIPARVAVGFTWGEQDPGDPELYRVRGEHAHAWPEVYIPGSGWVAFEPTPTRGAPLAAQWTGVEPQQAGSTDEPELLPDPDLGAPDTSPIPDLSDLPDLAPEADPVPVGEVEEDGVPGWYVTVGLVVGAILGAIALYALAMVGAKRWRRARRFAIAADNRARVQAIWAEAVESLRPLGLTKGRTETVQEFTARAGERSRAASPELAQLGALTVQATYSAEAPADPVVEQAQSHRAQVATEVTRLTTPTQRWRNLLDPRPLFKR